MQRLTACVHACSIWLSHASNARGFTAKLRDFSLQPELHTNILPLTDVTHAAPELMSEVRPGRVQLQDQLRLL